VPDVAWVEKGDRPLQIRAELIQLPPVLAIGAAVTGWMRAPGTGESDDGLVRRAALEFPPEFAWARMSQVAISPTGTHVAVSGGDGEASNIGIWIRALSEPEFRLIPDTDRAFGFTFSPDGHELAVSLRDEGRIVRMALDGSDRRTVLNDSALDLSWADTGELYFLTPPDGALSGSVRRAPIQGGVEAVEVLPPTSYPTWLSDV